MQAKFTTTVRLMPDGDTCEVDVLTPHGRFTLRIHDDARIGDAAVLLRLSRLSGPIGSCTRAPCPVSGTAVSARN